MIILSIIIISILISFVYHIFRADPFDPSFMVFISVFRESILPIIGISIVLLINSLI